MNRKFISNIVLLSVCMLFAASCIKLRENRIRLPHGEDYFDFKTEQNTMLDLDYGFPLTDYIVLFEIYAENPISEDAEGQLVKTGIEPLYRAATDGSGRFCSNIQLPAAMSTVWLYSDYPGTLSPIELEVESNKIVFNQKEYIRQQTQSQSATRATTPNNFTYPDGWQTMGDWDNYGVPDYMDSERTLPSAATLYNINEIFVKSNTTPLKERYPQFFAPGLSSNIQITKPTKIYLTFIHTTAAWRNTVGYHTYPTGQEPQTTADIQQVMVYPSVTQFIRKTNDGIVRGALNGGDRVQLKYWDGTKFLDEFPAGVTIGWWLEGMGFSSNDGNIAIQGNGRFTRFSSDHLNADGERRTVALLDSKTGRIVAISFEDNIDKRYNDATFYLEVEESGAIGGEIPEIPDAGGGPSEEENYVKTDGFLMFEDLWPHAGDYDMNDVMVKYSCKTYKNILGNTVYKTVSEFTPYHNGGSLKAGFGFQWTGLSNAAIHKLTVEGGAPSSYMEGQSLEPGQISPTVVLFDDVRAALNNTFVVTAEMNDVAEASVAAPYNPFIFTESDKIRGKEVHLVKQLPTDKADKELLGTGRDGSRPELGVYYILMKYTKQYPFALNISFVENFPIPSEGTNIDLSYPKFREWVESNGKNNKDWYLYPAES